MSRTYTRSRIRESFARDKLALCIRIARDDSRNYRETGDRRFMILRREAMRDARDWRDQI